MDLGASVTTRQQYVARRAFAVGDAAESQGGVVHRDQLRGMDVGRNVIRNEVAARRWTVVGRKSIQIGSGPLTPVARLWVAVWECATGAVLDGASSLLASGLTGFEPSVIDLSVPGQERYRVNEGTRVTVRRQLARATRAGLPRSTIEVAMIRAAQLAASDRQAALLICLPVQQRLTASSRLLAAWSGVRRSPRRAHIDLVIKDVCDGAHSLGELDFGRFSRAVGLPQPARQAVRRGPSGRIYLDVRFHNGLVVEVDGAHHLVGFNPVDDALRANAVTLDAQLVLRIPVLGLRLEPAAFMTQVVHAHRLLQARATAW
ncbi:hypothetical protein [Nostocoides vanveenii]